MATQNVSSLRSHWWIWLIQGLLLTLVGWLLLTNVAGTSVTLVEILGFYWIISGVIEIVLALLNKTNGKSRGWELASGIIGSVAGLIVVNNPIAITVFLGSFLVYLIAFAFIFSGVVRIFLGSARTGKNTWHWGSFVVGIVYLIVGLMLVGGPIIAEMAAVIMVLGVCVIFAGIMTIIASFMVKGLK